MKDRKPYGADNGTITFTGAKTTAFDGNINTFTGKITIAPNHHVTFKTLGNVEELILGANSSVRVTDLNHKVFKNPTDQDKTIVLSGENITFDDQENPYA